MKTAVSQQPVRFEHLNAKKLLAPNAPAGLAITTMRYLGKNISLEQVQRIYRQLERTEQQRLETLVPSLPGWMIERLRQARVIGASAIQSQNGNSQGSDPCPRRSITSRHTCRDTTCANPFKTDL
jgi:hypothetical protein